ncbi:MAG TPA: DUF885 domain-containing protein [Casimicrobiaceae bacterium]|nr:DUF885 domain-containing protein [Casimicrobiaceae bacterium]
MTVASSTPSAPRSATALAQLFSEERAFAWREDPLTATAEGVRTYDNRLPSVTPDAQARRLAADEDFLRRLHDIDRASLNKQEGISYDIFEFMVASRVTSAQYREWRLPFNSDSGFFSDLLQLDSLHDPQTTKQYEDYIARLDEIPRYFDENIANARTGMREGFTLPAAVIDGVSSIVAAAQYKAPEDSPFWRPFASFADRLPDSDRERLSDAAKAALAHAVMPAYTAFQRFFEREYRPAARSTIGASALPNGRAYYGDLVRYFTTLPDATPESIHRAGVAEVARIRAEMEAIVREVGFNGSFAEFLAFLRTDPRFYAKTADALLYQAAWICKEIDGKLPRYFGKLPRTPYGVKPVPEALAPNYTSGRYNPGPIGAAGEYWVNTHALETRALYALPALTLHEAVPGHHLQIALARELTDLPRFRRNFYPHAFGEGWALYTEKLGEEMDIYHTPYTRFGRLAYEMWRACRLVIDTGMHAMEWTRERALDYLASNTALSKHEVRTEVDRYISWPGQALAYKVGELEIVALRKRAEAALGERFDLRAFHDAILENGGVTLPILARQIDAYVQRASDGC